jgi:hypothetical protein
MLDKITTTTIHNSIQLDLRDYLAGQAMSAFILTEVWPRADKVAELAYEQADAMLAARKQTDTTQPES